MKRWVDSLNSSYRVPLYIQIEELIQKKISEQEFLPGAKIPSERAIAEMYGVNRMTAKKAISNLVLQGVLVRKPGSGTYVKSNGARSDRFSLDLAFTEQQSNAGMSELLGSEGVTVGSRVIGSELTSATAFFARKLGIPVGGLVFALHRTRSSNERVFAVEYNYLPSSMFTDADTVNFQEVGLYDYLTSKGHAVRHIDQRTEVITAMPREARLLGVEAGSLIYRIKYLSTDAAGSIVEYTESYLNPEMVSLNFTVGEDVFGQAGQP